MSMPAEVDVRADGAERWITKVFAMWRQLASRIRIGPYAEKASIPKLAVLCRLSLGGSKTIFVVQVYQEKFLIASGNDTITAMLPLMESSISEITSVDHGSTGR